MRCVNSRRMDAVNKPMNLDPRFATRLNSFRGRPELCWSSPGYQPSVAELIARAGTAQGLHELELNFPDHLEGTRPKEIADLVQSHGLQLNGLAMRYYKDPAFKLGAFTHPDRAVRRGAVDLTRRAVDALREMDGKLLTVWPGQDGWDYPFQADYRALWEWEVEGIRAVADHAAPDVFVSIEYKPNDPRAHSVLGTVGGTLLALREVDRPNTGVTFDFAHALYAGEHPAFVAALIQRESRLLGLHLNDGYAGRDDGLMVGSVHASQTLELLWTLQRSGYQGVIYFDTFPDLMSQDPVRECENNIAVTRALLARAARLSTHQELEEAIRLQDAVASQRIVQDVLFDRAAAT